MGRFGLALIYGNYTAYDLCMAYVWPIMSGQYLQSVYYYLSTKVVSRFRLLE